jgi:hypothetical protein
MLAVGFSDYIDIAEFAKLVCDLLFCGDAKGLMSIPALAYFKQLTGMAACRGGQANP